MSGNRSQHSRFDPGTSIFFLPIGKKVFSESISGKFFPSGPFRLPGGLDGTFQFYSKSSKIVQ